MVYKYFDVGVDGKGLFIIKAPHYIVLLPRLMSSIMMHLNVIQEVEQGIMMMKYAVNQPYMFVPFNDCSENSDENRSN